MAKTTLADIANALGVSKTLVSLVLNGRGDEHGINSDTQKRVIQKAKELNYRPNPIARGLRTGKSNTIGLIVTDISNIFMAKIARAIEDTVRSHKYHLIFCSSDEDPEREQSLIQMLQERQVDGLIVMTASKEKETIKQLMEEKLPLVLIDRHLDGIDANYVGVNNYEGAKQAVEHLISVGHQKIAMFTITPKHLSPILEREKGYREALKSNEISIDESLIRDIPHDKIKEVVYKELDDLCKPTPKIDALFVANNSMAIACLQYFNEFNIEIPKDLALISFDDIELFKFSNPPISAVAQPIHEIGEQAVEILFQQINTKDKSKYTTQQLELAGELIVRESTSK